MSFGIGAVLETLLLAVALSMDTLVAALAYGAAGIKIPFRVTCLLSLVCSLCLALTLQLGSVLSPLFPRGLTRWICVAVLLVLGVLRLLDSVVKSWIRRQKGQRRDITLSIPPLQLILIIYADPEEADRDRSRSLSLGEAASLAVALSLDSLAAGFGVGLAQYHVGLAFVLSFVCGVAAVLLGRALGESAAGRLPGDLGWLSGVLLILLAVLRA